ncbi:MAG: division/cell wall cluster transcriptional repressor MraZ [Gammaproteobacteria bacterium]
MFQGGSTVNLDVKGRLALPTRYRPQIIEDFNKQLVLTVHVDGCLLLYPQPVWNDIQRRLSRLPNLDKRTRMMVRMLLGHAEEVEMDAHGRIRIDQRLRDFAKLEKRISLAGVGNKFEIWNDGGWDDQCKDWQSSEELESGDMPDSFTSLTL